MLVHKERPFNLVVLHCDVVEPLLEDGLAAGCPRGCDVAAASLGGLLLPNGQPELFLRRPSHDRLVDWFHAGRHALLVDERSCVSRPEAVPEGPNEYIHLRGPLGGGAWQTS